jgi:hypothetical protein
MYAPEGRLLMGSKGYVQGNVVILAKPLPVPDGTEVEIIVSPKLQLRRTRRKTQAPVAQETFGLIPADPVLVRAVLIEDIYES